LGGTLLELSLIRDPINDESRQESRALLPVILVLSSVARFRLCAALALSYCCRDLSGATMQQFSEITAESKYVKARIAAQIHGVHVRTLDRWARAGLIDRPRVINRVKYFDVATLMAAGAKRG
jgi:hypothetical protein